MKKDILALLSLALIIAVLIHGTNIQSVDEYYLTHIDDITPQSETVFISIRCDTVLQNYDELDKVLQSDKYVPQNGVILPETEYVLRPGDTVFDILDRAVRYNKIQMEYQGADKNSYGSVYVQGIIFLRTAFGLDVSGERRISELRMLKIQTEGRRPNSMGLYLRSRQGRRLYMDGR